MELPQVKAFAHAQQLSKEVLESTEIEIKYAGYIEKEKNNADKLNRLEDIRIPESFNYDKLTSLSFESREKLKKYAQLLFLKLLVSSGVSPADISILLVYMGR